MPKTKKPKPPSKPYPKAPSKPKSKPKPNKGAKPPSKPYPKAPSKPKVSSTKSTMPSAKSPVVIREKTPCCTDVLKIGQAYTVPFGFVDYKGTQRIGQESKPFKTLGEEPTSIIPSAKKSSVSTTTTADASTQVDTIRVARHPPPAVEAYAVEESDSPVQDLVQSGVMATIKIPRKNSRADLENRYEAMVGRKYSGPKLTNAEFRQMVETFSNKKNI